MVSWYVPGEAVDLRILEKMFLPNSPRSISLKSMLTVFMKVLILFQIKSQSADRKICLNEVDFSLALFLEESAHLAQLLADEYLPFQLNEVVSEVEASLLALREFQEDAAQVLGGVHHSIN